VKFGRVLLLIVLVGFGVRVAYVVGAKGESCTVVVNGRTEGVSPSECVVGDQLFYNTAANRLAAGDGYNEPLWNVLHPGEDPPPAADHPPLTITVLAGVSWIAEHTPGLGDELDTNVREHRWTMVLLGTAMIALVGLLGRRVAGDAAGLLAAGIVAISPNVWVNDGLVMSETLTSLLVVTVLLLAVSWRKEPTPGRVAILGALCGLAALARAEMLLLVPLVVIPVAWHKPDVVQRVITGVAASLLVIAPWVIYNNVRFDERTFLSTNDGIALAGSNCYPVYHGPATGLTSYEARYNCLDDPPPPGDQSEVAKVYRQRALEYMQDHKGRAAVVAAARVGRTWSLFRPADMIQFNKGEGRESWVTRLGLWLYYPTLVAAVAGVVILFRRREFLVTAVLLAPAVIVTLSSAATYGQTRFRAAAEPVLAVFAAVALAALWDALRRNRQVAAKTGASSSSSSETVAPTPAGSCMNASTAIA
jgi:hypothetical protein